MYQLADDEQVESRMRKVILHLSLQLPILRCNPICMYIGYLNVPLVHVKEITIGLRAPIWPLGGLIRNFDKEIGELSRRGLLAAVQDEQLTGKNSLDR